MVSSGCVARIPTAPALDLDLFIWGWLKLAVPSQKEKYVQDGDKWGWIRRLNRPALEKSHSLLGSKTLLPHLEHASSSRLAAGQRMSSCCSHEAVLEAN